MATGLSPGIDQTSLGVDCLTQRYHQPSVPPTGYELDFKIGSDMVGGDQGLSKVEGARI